MSSTIISRNPATDEILATLQPTDPASLPELRERARKAQQLWAAHPLKLRAQKLRVLREVLLDHLDEIADLIARENGKPRFEAIANELLPSLELITYMARVAPRALSDQKLAVRMTPHKKSCLNYWPLGVVSVISPWNFPFFLPFGDIVMALAAGNAVLFKPSEVTPLVGQKIQQLLDEAGFPESLVQTLIGDGSLGEALVRARTDKIFFTGSVPTGKKIAQIAAETLTPVNLELGGKNAMIVLPDADLDFASSSILWGAYGNSGQVCAAISRVLVHESIAEPLIAEIERKAALLRPNTDLGFITLDKQANTYERHLQEAKTKGARIVFGGEFNADRKRLKPTLIAGQMVGSLDLYREETFGPLASLVTFKTTAEAIQKANNSTYGLVASIVTKNLNLADEIARQLEVGTVMINEVTYTAGLPETPWGGVKESGIGRTHSEQGLYEFVHVRHIHKPAASFLTFKAPWWFPYSPFQEAMIRQLAETYRLQWIERLRAIPHLLWNLAQFIKREPRL